MLDSEVFDFEEAIKKVSSKKTQKYLNEVMSTYYNKEYRSCIVMLYATTFADALEKIKIMSEVYQNEKARQFLEEYDAGRKSEKRYSNLEKLVYDFIIDSGLVNDVEKKQWEHLKDYRDYCAHPVVESDYELISPNAEQVRMHIRNMFEMLFLKDAILTDSKVFEEFLKKTEDYYDRNGLDGLEEYVKVRYINRMDLPTKQKFVKNLWIMSFHAGDEECEQYRIVAYRLLVWIMNSSKGELLKFISENIGFFDGKIKFESLEIEVDEKNIRMYEHKNLALLYFLHMEPEVYAYLSEDNKTEIRRIINKNVNLIFYCDFVYETSNEHIEEIEKMLVNLNDCLSYWHIKDVCSNAINKFDYSYNDLLIEYFFECQNSELWSPDWDYVNLCYRDIICHYIPYFTYKQFDTFLSRLDMFYKQATCFRNMAKLIVDTCKKKRMDIKFEEYEINLLEYID